jgi:hypothetical protein
MTDEAWNRDEPVRTDKVAVKTLILKKGEEADQDGLQFNIRIMAEKIGVHRVYVSYVINNQVAKLSNGMFNKIQSGIAAALGVNLNEIQQEEIDGKG